MQQSMLPLGKWFASLWVTTYLDKLKRVSNYIVIDMVRFLGQCKGDIFPL